MIHDDPVRTRAHAAHAYAPGRAYPLVRGRRHAPSRLRASVLFGALGILAGGCGNVTSGGFGEVEVLLTSDVLEEVSSAFRVAGAVRGAGDDLTGTLSARTRIEVRVGDRWVEITGGTRQVVVPLEDATPTVVATAPLAEGDYDAIRTIFGTIVVHVERGLVIDGEPVTGEIIVDVGAGGVIVEHDEAFHVTDGSAVSIVLEMRARSWLPLVDRERRVVDVAEFRRLFRARAEPRR